MFPNSGLPSPSYVKSLLTSSTPPLDPPEVKSTITALSLQSHPEGGFFVETDRDPRMVPNPFLDEETSDAIKTNGVANGASARDGDNDSTDSLPPEEHEYLHARRQSSDLYRHASTTIHYFLTPSSPLGRFHRNKARTVHTLHWGRGAYVVLHPPEHREENDHDPNTDVSSGADRVAEKANRGWRVETLIVGKEVANGEKVQWIVEGGRYKASYLLTDTGGVEDSQDSEAGSKNGLLISETVVPGFEFADHDFLTAEKFLRILGREKSTELGWLLGTEEGKNLASLNAE